jgi:hypothetical protein
MCNARTHAPVDVILSFAHKQCVRHNSTLESLESSILDLAGARTLEVNSCICLFHRSKLSPSLGAAGEKNDDSTEVLHTYPAAIKAA